MSLASRVVGSSFIYAVTTVLQKGIAFLLLPLYTRFLTPEDYGVLAVVGAINTFLLVFFSLSLHGAVSRYYFLYRDRPEMLREFLGTVVTVSLLISSGGAAALLAAGEHLLAPVYGVIPFWPYVAMGVATAAFQPLSIVFLAILQAREEVNRYAFHSLAQFGMMILLVLLFVVIMQWDAQGPLLAGLSVAVAYSVISLYLLRNDYRCCVRSEHLRNALSYSLPLIPHSVASQVAASSDRILLNALVGTASAGLYNMGAMCGGVMAFIADGVNRAYVPVSMGILQAEDRHRMDEIARMGLMIVAGLSLTASAVSLFAKEAIAVLTTPAFHESHVVVPWIAFSFVLTGIYYLVVNIFFFNVRLTKIVAAGSVIGAILNVGLNYVLITACGLVGAAIAALLAQLATTVIIAVLGRRYDPVAWDYKQMILILTVCLGVVTLVNVTNFSSHVVAVLGKVGVLFALSLVISHLVWRNPVYLMRYGVTAVREKLGAMKAA